MKDKIQKLEMKIWLKVANQVNSRVVDRVRGQINHRVGGRGHIKVWFKVWEQINVLLLYSKTLFIIFYLSVMKNNIRKKIWDQVERNQVFVKVRGHIEDKVFYVVRDKVLNLVWNRVGDQVGVQIYDQVLVKIEYEYKGF